MENLYEKLQVMESEKAPLSRLQRLKAMNGPLLSWYRNHARILPWRENPESYRVWISEIMLQQTRVEAVKPYFNRFLEELPDVQTLAEVDEERLLKLWEGLGYYNRARNLKKAAQVIMEEYDGALPASYEKLLELPGIGSYTAGAIASIAYGIPVPAVDGNVLRVLSRVLASHEDILKQSVKHQMEEELRQTMPAENASEFNQGLIEIGAIVCVPNGQPKCGECPLASICLARKQGLLDSIPYKARKKPRKIQERTILLVEAGDKVAIEKRPDHGLLAALYQFPNLEGKLEEEEVIRFLEHGTGQVTHIERVGDAKHVFSHVEWHMTGYRVSVELRTERECKAEEECEDEVSGAGAYFFVEREEIREKYPIPNAFAAYTKLLIGES